MRTILFFASQALAGATLEPSVLAPELSVGVAGPAAELRASLVVAPANDTFGIGGALGLRPALDGGPTDFFGEFVVRAGPMNTEKWVEPFGELSLGTDFVIGNPVNLTMAAGGAIGLGSPWLRLVPRAQLRLGDLFHADITPLWGASLGVRLELPSNPTEK